jgi:CheY-like chemotaxis protein
MQGYRVLIVEDRSDHLDQFSECVRIGIEGKEKDKKRDRTISRLDTASTKYDAIQLLDRVYYHIALVDLRLKNGPDNWDGFDVAKRVFEFNQHMDLGAQVIMLTAYGDVPKVRQAFRQYKVLDFIEKEADNTIDNLILAVEEGATLVADHDRRLLIRRPKRLDLMKAAKVDLSIVMQGNVSPEDTDKALARVLYGLDPLLIAREQPKVVSLPGQMPVIEVGFWSKALGQAIVLRLGAQDEIEADVRILDKDPALMESRGYENKVAEMFAKGLGAVAYVLVGDLFDQFEVPVF